jgi:putative addiction module component (TIGR02574 family)
MNSVLQDALKLSLPERIQLVQDLWDSISSESGHVTQADVIEAEKRLSDYQKDSNTAVSWELIAEKLGLEPSSKLL